MKSIPDDRNRGSLRNVYSVLTKTATYIQFKGPNSDAGGSPRTGQTNEVFAANVAGE